MIIDAHTHVLNGPWAPAWLWDWINDIESRIFKRPAAELAAERQKVWDPTGNRMVENLKHAGIDRAVVCVVDMGYTDHGVEAPLPIEEINRQTADMVKKHSDHLVFCAGVDPRRKHAIELLDTAVKKWNAKAVKLHPSTGFFPNDKRIYPFYQKCSDLGIVVDFHSGPQPYPMKNQCAFPIYFEEVAEDFPELTIQCTHAGDLLYMDMLGVAKGHQNVIVDMASWQRWTFGSRSTELMFWRALRFMIDMIGPRVMFASDWDCTRLDDSELVNWTQSFRKIPSYVKEAGIDFTKAEIDEFMGGTAVKRLHL